MPLILPKAGSFSLEEKRSKFYGYCAPVTTSDEAMAVVEDLRRRYRGASHYVFAYGLSACNTVRFSDDGEPSGTAGMPVLTVFQKGGVIDFVCVVTRYFGGTLLGAGGLVRAYTKAAKGALEAAGPQERVVFRRYRVRCDYAQHDKMKHQFKAWQVEILDLAYTQHCEALVQVREEWEPAFLQGGFYDVFEEAGAVERER